VYVFYICGIYFLVIMYFPVVPKIVKILKIVLTVYYLLEYSVVCCLLGEREFP
jgi:hypothetical protein